MSVIDVLLVVLMLAFAASGYRQGFLIGIMSFVGFFGGALIGLQLGPLLADQLADGPMRIVVSLVTVFGIAVLGQAVVGWLGTHLRHAITSRTGQTVDDVGGAVVSLIAVALVAWLVAIPLGSSSLPWLARSVRNSALLGGIDKVMPAQAEVLSDALRKTLDTRGFPDVFGNFAPTRVTDVPAPDPALANSRVVVAAQHSVVKILGSAPSCSRRIEGSGFVYAPQHVMTNAHVVAGTRSIVVEVRGHRHDARVVLYDPERDLAVVYVPGLDAPAMRLSTVDARSGDGAIVLGFPLDGPYNAQSARVRDVRRITGPDIYDSGDVTREIYTIRALVRSGNSGGPLVAANGRVLGVIFAAAADDPSTGFAVTADEASGVATAGQGRTSGASTGPCT